MVHYVLALTTCAGGGSALLLTLKKLPPRLIAIPLGLAGWAIVLSFGVGIMHATGLQLSHL